MKYGNTRSMIATDVGNMNQRAENASLRERLGSVEKYVGAIQDYKVKSSRLQELQGGIASAYQRYAELESDPNAPKEAKAAALENLGTLEMLSSSMNIDNIDKFGELYSKLSSNNSKYADLMTQITRSKIAANAVMAAANARADGAAETARIKEIADRNKQSRALNQTIGSGQAQPQTGLDRVNGAIDLYSLNNAILGGGL
jgi:hypothetical protein